MNPLIHQEQSHGVCVGLATLPPRTHLDIAGLAHALGRCERSVERAYRRGELPPPFRLFGRRVWLAGTILQFLQTRQDAAVASVVHASDSRTDCSANQQ